MTAEPDKKEEIWMSCRAKQGCPGTKAVMVFKKNLPMGQGGGVAIRYRCLTCGGAWHIRM